MQKVVDFLQHYVPFSLFSKMGEAPSLTINDILWVQCSIICITIIVFVMKTFSLIERFKWYQVFISFLVSILGLIVLMFLSYFIIKNELILIFNCIAIGFIALCSLGFLGSINHMFCGILCNSMLKYFSNIEEKKRIIQEYSDNYNELINFKL